MSWRDIFVSRHTKWLEDELTDLKLRHAAELAAVRSSFQKQLEDAITHNQRLRDELERTRMFLQPGIAHTELPHEQENESTPTAKEDFKLPAGTRWASVLEAEIEKERKRGLAQEAAVAAERAKGVTNNGGSGN